MRSKSKIVTYVSVALIVFALIGTVFMPDALGERLSTIITISTAIIGALALFVQFKRDRSVNVANFLMTLNEQVLNNERFLDVDKKLEFEHQYNEPYLTDEDKYNVVSLITWHECLCSLVLKKTIAVQDVDVLFGYRFFMMMNNKNVWELELKTELEYYPSICEVYPSWYNYRKNSGIFIINDETNVYQACVDMVEKYKQSYNEIKAVRRKKA